jgi:hypothetical protein
MKKIESYPGEHISKVAARMVEAVLDETEMTTTAVPTVMAEFNGTTIYATLSSTVESIVADFNRQFEENARAYRESPEGKESVRRQESQRQQSQAKADDLMAQLPLLRFDDVVCLLDWLCEMEEPRDRVGVKVKTDEIISVFRIHGYEANVNCDADFRPDDADNVARWLIGQALSIPYVPLVRKFREDWKQKFLR